MICCSTDLCTHRLPLICALTVARTLNLGISGQRSNQLRYPARPSQKDLIPVGFMMTCIWVLCTLPFSKGRDVWPKEPFKIVTGSLHQQSQWLFIYVCIIFFFIDDRRDVSRYGEDNRGYGGSQGGGRGRGGYDKDGRGPMTGPR